MPGAFGAKIKQASLIVAKLCEEKSTAIAKIRVVVIELVPVIAHRKRLLEVIRQWREATEVCFPVLRA